MTDDNADLLQRMKDNLAAYGMIENGDLREAISVIERESSAADMIAEERDAWEKRAKALEADNAALRQKLEFSEAARRLDAAMRLNAAMLDGKKP